MMELVRRSPVVLPGTPKTLEVTDRWEVIQAFEEESRGPALVDLSHIPRWDTQGDDLNALNHTGLSLPEKPGQCTLNQNILCSRLNPTQLVYWNLGVPRVPVPDDVSSTDITDAAVVLALLGKEAYGIMEKVSSMDLAGMGTEDPVIFQGPVAHVSCRVVVLCGAMDNVGILVSCARGYGVEMAACLLSAGRSLGLQPAGFGRFSRWLNSIGDPNH
jgi:hypothetical protein